MIGIILTVENLQETSQDCQVNVTLFDDKKERISQENISIELLKIKNTFSFETLNLEYAEEVCWNLECKVTENFIL